MLRSTPCRPHPLLALALLIALLGAGLPQVARTAVAASSLTANPPALSVSVPLGQSTVKSVTITNTSGAVVHPAIYEAWPVPSGALARTQRPSGPSRTALPEQSARIDPQLLAELQPAPDRRSDFLVYLRDRADLSAAYTIRDWAARGQYVYQALVDWAASHQSDLRRQIAARGLAYRPLWIVNAILVHGTLADAQALAGRGDVALVRANHITALPAESSAAATSSSCSPDQPANLTCWDIRKIGADRVWRDFGIDGRGVVVASIDTGVSFDHPALAGSYRGYLGPGRYDHNYNWFDPKGGRPTPADDVGHGTHTMGTMVAAGDGTTAQPAVGVAPGARWIAAEGCDFYCTDADLIAAAQWMLAPMALDGSRPRPDLRPLIVNNSWAGGGADPWYSGYTAAWRAAGIFPVFAAGNASGYPTTCRSVASPGDYPDVVGVGATDQNDTIGSFSLLGPTADDRMKPDFSAPGVKVLSTWTGGTSYQVLDGTSMAAPHLAGVVALLWSANPSLIGDYDATYAILRDSAQRRSDTRCGDAAGAPNNVYGYGRIDAYAAVARARTDVPWLIAPSTLQTIGPASSASLSVTLDARRVAGPGTYTARLQVYADDLSKPPTTIAITLNVTPTAQQAVITGSVVSTEGGTPPAATVGVRGGLQVPTDSSGVYTLTLAFGDYELVAGALSFLPAQRTVSVTGDRRLSAFALRPDQPRIALTTASLSTTLAFQERRTIPLTIGNHGTRPLNYRVDIPRDRFGVWRSDEPGGPTYSWIDLPANAPQLLLADTAYSNTVPLKINFPFFNYTFTETLVTSDGMLGFSEPIGNYRGPLSPCLPDNDIYFYLIAPFRADLDPSRAGKIRYGALPGNRTFVLSYENIPLHSGPLTATYTFQVLLHEDGRIGFQYKKLAPLPNKVSAGVQYEPSDVEQIACGPGAPLFDGLALELRPQIPADLWVTKDTDEGTVQPGGQQTINVRLTWVRPMISGPYRARIAITSSDPTRMFTTLPVQALMQSVPYERRLPILFTTP